MNNGKSAWLTLCRVLLAPQHRVNRFFFLSGPVLMSLIVGLLVSSAWFCLIVVCPLLSWSDGSSLSLCHFLTLSQSHCYIESFLPVTLPVLVCTELY